MKEFLNELSNTIKKFILKDGTEIVPKKVKLTYETYSIFFNKKSIKVIIKYNMKIFFFKTSSFLFNLNIYILLLKKLKLFTNANVVKLILFY